VSGHRFVEHHAQHDVTGEKPNSERSDIPVDDLIGIRLETGEDGEQQRKDAKNGNEARGDQHHQETAGNENRTFLPQRREERRGGKEYEEIGDKGERPGKPEHQFAETVHDNVGRADDFNIRLHEIPDDETDQHDGWQEGERKKRHGIGEHGTQRRCVDGIGGDERSVASRRTGDGEFSRKKLENGDPDKTGDDGGDKSPKNRRADDLFQFVIFPDGCYAAGETACDKQKQNAHANLFEEDHYISCNSGECCVLSHQQRRSQGQSHSCQIGKPSFHNK